MRRIPTWPPKFIFILFALLIPLVFVESLKADFEELERWMPGKCAISLVTTDGCGGKEEIRSLGSDMRLVLWIPVGMYQMNREFKADNLSHRLMGNGLYLLYSPFIIAAGALGLATDIVTSPFSLIKNAIHKHYEP